MSPTDTDLKKAQIAELEARTAEIQTRAAENQARTTCVQMDAIASYFKSVHDQGYHLTPEQRGDAVRAVVANDLTLLINDLRDEPPTANEGPLIP